MKKKKNIRKKDPLDCPKILRNPENQKEISIRLKQKTKLNSEKTIEKGVYNFWKFQPYSKQIIEKEAISLLGIINDLIIIINTFNP